MTRSKKEISVSYKCQESTLENFLHESFKEEIYTFIAAQFNNLKSQ